MGIDRGRWRPLGGAPVGPSACTAPKLISFRWLFSRRLFEPGQITHDFFRTCFRNQFQPVAGTRCVTCDKRREHTPVVCCSGKAGRRARKNLRVVVLLLPPRYLFYIRPSRFSRGRSISAVHAPVVVCLVALASSRFTGRKLSDSPRRLVQVFKCGRTEVNHVPQSDRAGARQDPRKARAESSKRKGSPTKGGGAACEHTWLARDSASVEDLRFVINMMILVWWNYEKLCFCDDGRTAGEGKDARGKTLATAWHTRDEHARSARGAGRPAWFLPALPPRQLRSLRAPEVKHPSWGPF